MSRGRVSVTIKVTDSVTNGPVCNAICNEFVAQIVTDSNGIHNGDGHFMDVKERMRRYRARKRGEVVEKLKPGPKVGSRPYVEERSTTVTPPRDDQETTKTPPRKTKYGRDEAETQEVRTKDAGKTQERPPDLQNWREKRAGGKVIWQCRGCGTWWGARHTMGCRYGGE